MRIIKEMFEASVDGQPYDNERWGNYYRPYGLEAPAGTTADKHSEGNSQNASSPATEPVADDEPEAISTPISIPKSTPGSDKAQDILAMIKARKAAASAS